MFLNMLCKIKRSCKENFTRAQLEKVETARKRVVIETLTYRLLIAVLHNSHAVENS